LRQLARARSHSSTANFPGGNIIVERTAGAAIHIRPDLRHTREWWFY
jgi:hypothetical protein